MSAGQKTCRLKSCSCIHLLSYHTGLQYIVQTPCPDLQPSRHCTLISAEYHSMFSSTEEFAEWICLLSQDSDSWIYTELRKKKRCHYQSEKSVGHTQTHTHSLLLYSVCVSLCVIHFTGATRSKTRDERALRGMRAASAVIVLPPVGCWAANTRHPASQLAHYQAGRTDYRFHRFSYSQHNILVPSGRRTLKTNTFIHLCQKFLFVELSQQQGEHSVSIFHSASCHMSWNLVITI